MHYFLFLLGGNSVNLLDELIGKILNGLFRCLLLILGHFVILLHLLAKIVSITPTNDGKVIRLIFPQLTEERRKELVKQVQKMGEDAKVAIRNVRRDANDLCKKMKKDNEMTEDEQKASEKAIQDLTDKYIKDVDGVTSKKEKEIMQI